MDQSKNHYAHFQEFIADTSVDDLLKTTCGHQQSSDAIKAVNKWIRKKIGSKDDLMKFDELFNSCLVADEKLWFNLAW